VKRIYDLAIDNISRKISVDLFMSEENIFQWGIEGDEDSLRIDDYCRRLCKGKKKKCLKHKWDMKLSEGFSQPTPLFLILSFPLSLPS
jgi:hypothetical protein